MKRGAKRVGGESEVNNCVNVPGLADISRVTDL